MNDYDNWNFWAWRKPTKKVQGGIKARATKFGESWWAARWLELMQSRSMNRLARGRSYARKGQITDFDVKAGKITGQIQGSAEEPYEVLVWSAAVPPKIREKIISQLRMRPIFSAKLLNRE